MYKILLSLATTLALIVIVISLITKKPNNIKGAENSYQHDQANIATAPNEPNIGAAQTTLPINNDTESDIVFLLNKNEDDLDFNSFWDCTTINPAGDKTSIELRFSHDYSGDVNQQPIEWSHDRENSIKIILGTENFVRLNEITFQANNAIKDSFTAIDDHGESTSCSWTILE